MWSKPALNPLMVVHGQDQSFLCKSLLRLEITRTPGVEVGPLCPASGGVGQFVAVTEMT
jgi:hypothetical protein